MDEDVSLAELWDCARLALIWGLGLPVCCGMGGPRRGVGLVACWAVLGRYFDPAGDRDR